MTYMGSEVVQLIEGQMLGRVFLELGVRGCRMRWWLSGGSLLVQDISYEGMLGVC